MAGTVRWTIEVSQETDGDVHSFLETQGIDEANFSKFVGDAVREEVFRRTIRDIKKRNADTDPEELQAIIDDAVKSVRAEPVNGYL